MANYIEIEDSKRISMSWIYLCAERDYFWASLLIDRTIDSRNSPSDISAALSYLEAVKTAVERVQLSGEKDIIYRHTE